ncbi:MAG: GNAT family N-acetyltransferase [Rubrivivax sp.]|nr:GNAT family N-acetyltransferase [Rubrivivax sp.]
MAMPVHRPAAMTPAVAIRPLAATDLDAVVALDAASHGQARRDYIERRLRAAQRESGLHVQFAAVDAAAAPGGGAGGLLGFMLARVLAGEFGRRRPALRLELLGVRAEHRGAGIGRRLHEAVSQWAQRHGCTELRSAADWRHHAVLGWFDAMGFRLASERIVECSVEGGRWHPGRDEPAGAVPGDEDAPGGAAAREIDYGRREALATNDYERAARDGADVRSMSAADLDAVVRIDRRITGADRREYIAARLAEALAESGVRVSLAAFCEGTPAGYLMARADLGDYGRTEPVAVIDTLGVDPDFAHRGIGQALLSQLFANLGALRVERVETLVPYDAAALAEFFRRSGFAPAQRLAFVRRLDNAKP